MPITVQQTSGIPRKGSKERPLSIKEYKEKLRRIKEAERKAAVQAGKDIVLSKPGTGRITGYVRGGRVERKVKELQKKVGKDTPLKVERSLPKLKEAYKRTGKWEGSLAEYTRAYPKTRVAAQTVQVKHGESAKSVLTKLRQKSKVYDTLYVKAPSKGSFMADSPLARKMSIIPGRVSDEGEFLKMSSKDIEGFAIDTSKKRVTPTPKAGRKFKVKKTKKEVSKLRVPTPSAELIKSKQIQRTFLPKDLKKYKDKRPIVLIKEYTEQLRTTKSKLKRGLLSFQIGIQRYKVEGENGLLDHADKLWVKDFKLDERLKFIDDTYKYVKKKNKEDALKFISTKKNQNSIQKAANLLKLGTKTSGEKVLKLAKYGKEHPFRTIKTYVDLTVASTFVPPLIKKGLQANVITSALTKIGTTGMGAAYVYNTISGYKKAKDKQQYVINKTFETLTYRLAFKNVDAKEAFNIKKAIAQLSPFYKGKTAFHKAKIKTTAGHPRTTTKQLTKTQALKTNLYHVTSAKARDLIKNDVLKVLSKKTGMGKDRIRFNEDFLYVSDKGLLSYGVKGTKIYIETQLNKEALKVLKSGVKIYKSSDILKKINTKTKAEGKGKFNVKSKADKILLETVAEHKLVIGGQRATNLQVPKKYGRKTFDWDLTKKGADMNKIAKEYVKKLNEAYGKNRFELHIKLNGKLNQVYDKVAKDHIADFSAPFFKQNVANIGGIRVVHVDQLIQNKITALSDKTFQSRWTKDFKDLKNIIKGTGNKQRYNNLIKKYEKEIFRGVKGKADLTKIKATANELKEIGFSKNAINWLVTAKNNPLKYGALKVLLKLKTMQKPEKFNILEFKDMKIGKFPKKYNKLIMKAAEGKLSSKQQEALRFKLVELVKKNPNQFFPGTKSMANIAKPFGIEEEWVAAVGSKFYANKNIRSKFYKTFGLKKGEGIIYDDQLRKVIQIFELTKKKPSKTAVEETKEFLKLLKQKYSDPKRLIKELIKTHNVQISIDKSGKIQTIDNIPTIRRKLGIVKHHGLTIAPTKQIETKEPTKKIERRKPKIKERTVKAEIKPQPVRIAKRLVTEERKRIKPRPTDRRKPKITKPITPSPRLTIMPKRRIAKPRPKRELPRPKPRPTPRPSQPHPTPKRPPLPPELSLKLDKAIKKIKKKKKKIKFKYLYTSTLVGLGAKAKRVTGKFTGFETRGNIIVLKQKPIKVKKHKRKSLKTKPFVRRHRRKKPRK